MKKCIRCEKKFKPMTGNAYTGRYCPTCFQKRADEYKILSK